MKRFFLTLCLILTVLTAWANGIREDIDFSSEKARTSYAFGMTVGGDLQEAGFEIDYYAFTEGLKAAMEQEETIMFKDEAIEIVQNAFESVVRKQTAELAEKEDSFLRENASQPGISVTESGLQYTVLEEGSGPKPAADDTVLVHYEGALTDGTIFDSSYERGEPVEIPLEMVIPGWSEGIMLMNVGSKMRVYIPSSMAYGPRGAGQIIPPYSTLVFTVELLDIIETEDEDEAED